MTVVVWILALVAAAVHLLAFAWEVVLFEGPACITESSDPQR